MKKDIVQIIRDNPGAVAVIDNDCWNLYREHIENNPHDEDESPDNYDRWQADNLLVSSDDRFDTLGDGGYGSGSAYGGDILQALAVIAGITIVSV